jgi:hypothetical protein
MTILRVRRHLVALSEAHHGLSKDAHASGETYIREALALTGAQMNDAAIRGRALSVEREALTSGEPRRQSTKLHAWLVLK